MIIRNAELKDLDRVIEMGSDVKEFETSDEVVGFWPRYVLDNLVNSSKNIFLIAEDGGKIIGFLIANYNEVFRKAIIENIYVDGDARNDGIGGKLIKRAIKELEELGCEYICILTENTNDRGIDFYLKNGFNRGIDCAWLDMVLNGSFSKI